MTEYFVDSLESLDPKSSMVFFDDDIVEKNIGHMPSSITPLGFGHPDYNDTIFTIDNLLTLEECDMIISQCEKNGFEHVGYRNSDRIVTFDSNELLLETLMTRLESGCDIQNFAKDISKCKNWYYPPTFGNVKWSNDDNIPVQGVNPCIRINKYINSEFKVHRDSPYTYSNTVKSNYTLIIYLNDDFEYGSGTTTFYLTSDIKHCGQTVLEELNETKIDASYKITIVPKKGSAILFPQNLLHSGDKCNGIKYILRTDLITCGTYCEEKEKEKINADKISSKLQKLTKELFREAQYLELYDRTNGTNLHSGLINELYERCLSLRLALGSNLTTYPKHLELLLTDIPINLKILPSIKYIGRSGAMSIFRFNNIIDNGHLLALVKISAIFTMLTMTHSINSIRNNFVTILKKIGINTFSIPFLNNTNFNNILKSNKMIDFYKTKAICVPSIVADNNDLIEVTLPEYYSNHVTLCEFCSDYKNNIKYFCPKCSTCKECKKGKKMDDDLCEKCYELYERQKCYEDMCVDEYEKKIEVIDLKTNKKRNVIINRFYEDNCESQTYYRDTTKIFGVNISPSTIFSLTADFKDDRFQDFKEDYSNLAYIEHCKKEFSRLAISNDYKLTNPFSIGASVESESYDISALKCICSLGDYEDQLPQNKKILLLNDLHFYIDDDLFKKNCNDVVVEFKDVVFNENNKLMTNKIEGNIIFKYPSESFNHASCQCETGIQDATYVDVVDEHRVEITHKIKFCVDNNNICQIHIEPIIVI